MSHDLEVWSIRSVDRNTSKGNGWQIVINASNKVEPEDIADNIAGRLPGIAYRTELNLEGNVTKQAAGQLLAKAKQIARQTHGVVFDPQTDRVTTPSGVTRFVPTGKQRTFSVLTFSWWFMNDLMLSSTGRKSFLALLQKQLPEALPKRYGDYEPPKFHLVKTGIRHLERFIAKNLFDPMVWYPNQPVSGVSISCPKPLGSGVDGFRSNLIELEIDKAVLSQPGWARQLQVLWREMTFLLRPFYSEVRTEGGFVRSGGVVWATANSIKNFYPDTTRSWFWRGIPVSSATL